jgi:hypothetical protein
LFACLQQLPVSAVVFWLVNYIFFTLILSDEAASWSASELSLYGCGLVLSHCRYLQWYFGLLIYFFTSILSYEAACWSAVELTLHSCGLVQNNC